MREKELGVRRGEKVGTQSVTTMLDHCLSQVENNGFSEGIDWDTEIAENVTVEEMIGALVRSEYEFDRLKDGL